MTERNRVQPAVLEQRDATGIPNLLRQLLGDQVEQLALRARGLRRQYTTARTPSFSPA